MKKIKFTLEYKCFPVWIYDEDNKLIDNDLPSELIGDPEIDPLLVHIQEVFDSLFLDDKKEFKYIGFKNAEQRKSFLEEVSSSVTLLRNKLNGGYTVEVNMNKIRETVS